MLVGSITSQIVDFNALVLDSYKKSLWLVFKESDTRNRETSL